MHRTFIFTLLLLLALPIYAADHTPVLDVVALSHGGMDRSYVLAVPPDAENPPLIVALHDYGSSGKGFAAITELTASANAAGYAVVYPNNADYGWNDGRVAAGVRTVLVESDDVSFIEAVVADVAAAHDTGDVYLLGMGNGGSMAFRLMCESELDLAGVATVAAGRWSYQNEQGQCAEAIPPVNLVMFNGLNDTHFPLNGQDVPTFDGRPLSILGQAETLDHFAALFECEAKHIHDDLRITQHRGCAGDVTVAGVVTGGAAHHWLNPESAVNPLPYALNDVLLAYFGGGTWEEELEPITITRVTRSYTLYVPDGYNPSEPAAVVFVLHGRPGRGTNMVYFTDMNLVADEENFVVVYPDGLGEQWNYLQGLPLVPDTGLDDVAFLERVITDLDRKLHLDPERRYVTGFSNGGFMTQRLACDPASATTYTAFAIVGATLAPDFMPLCDQSPPVPILQIHGTDDISIPWEEMSVTRGERSRVISMSASGTMGYWVQRNGCNPNIEPETLPKNPASPEGTQVGRFAFTDCLGPDFVFYAVLNGGHNWPGVPDRIVPNIAGNVTRDLDASRAIWVFFESE